MLVYSQQVHRDSDMLDSARSFIGLEPFRITWDYKQLETKRIKIDKKKPHKTKKISYGIIK
jgi:hypothetical protein